MYASTPDRIDTICFCSLIVVTQLILNDLGKNRNYDSGSMDMKENLPKGWIKTTIDEICTTKSGGTPSRKNSNYFEGDVPWIKSGELNDSIILECEERISQLGLEKSNAVLHPKNTILMAMYGATIGKLSILGFPASTNQAICAIFNNQKIISNSYLFLFLKSIRNDLIRIGFGGAQKNISQEKIKQVVVPLPPLNEQKRIVSKIESIFTQIDAAKIQLEMLSSQVKSSSSSLNMLKNSVLKQAFEGKLVPQDPNDESAEVLLKKIHGDSKELKFKKENLPKGWIKTTIDEICTTKSGGTPSRKNSNYFEGDVPWIKSGELNDSIILECEERISQLGLEKSNAVLHPKNTILMAMYGATIGKLSILGFPASTNQAICAIFNNQKIISNSYLFLFLKSIRNDLIRIGFGGAQKNISQEKIKQVVVPLPPLNEQKRIVSKIESIFDKIDASIVSMRDKIIYKTWPCRNHLILTQL